MAAFFAEGDKELPPPPRTDPRAHDVNAVAAAKTNKLLNFTEDEGVGSGGGDEVDLGPALSLARHTPRAALTHSL